MTEDRHDAQIRNLVAELATSAPPAPAFSRIAERLPRTVPGANMTSADHDHAAGNAEPADLTPSYVTERTSRSKPWRLMAALVAFSLATAGGVFAYGALTEDDGAGTPEAAVEKFVNAFEQSDVSGLLEALAPSERVVLRESLQDLESEARRLELIKDLDLDDVSGVELQVEGLELSSTGLSPDVAKVSVKGTLRSTANDRELPLGDAARDFLADSLPDDGYQGVADAVDEAINREAGDGVQLVTLREADGWHVSVWYTIAEYLRTADDLPAPNFGNSPIKPLGAESPEAALRALIEASGHYDEMVALATPEESRVLYDYVPLWTARFADEENYAYDFRVLDLQTHTEGDGDRRAVIIDSYDLEGTSTYTYTSDEDSATSGTSEETPGRETTEPIETTETTIYRTSFDGDCFTTTYTSSGSPEDSPETDTTCRADALRDGVTEVEWDLAVHSQLTVELHDGRWFVSPTRSLVDETVAGLAILPDTKTFRDLVSSDDSSGIYLLPYDTLSLVLGGFPLGGPFMYSSSESGEGSSNGESSSSSSGPLPTIPEPATSVPTTSIPATTSPDAGSSATTAPTGGTRSTTAPETTVIGSAPATTATTAATTAPPTTEG